MRQLRLHTVLVWALTALLGAPFLTACGDGGGGGGGGGGTVTLTGQVTQVGAPTPRAAHRGARSAPSETVTVSAGGASSEADSNGFYVLEGVKVPADGRLVVTFEGEGGLATYQRSLTVEKGETYAVNAVMAVYDVNVPDQDPTAEIATAGDDGSGLSIPADSLLGVPEGQSVDVAVAVGDPSSPDGRATFPGDYMAAEAAGDDPDTPLESVAFVEITITDEDGNEITQVDPANPAVLTLTLPAEYQVGGDKEVAPDDTIEWWSYDEEQGTWLLEDAFPGQDRDGDGDPVDGALVVELASGDLAAIAQVTHFTWWNVDRPVSQHAALCVRVVDGDGLAQEGVAVYAEGRSYDGRTSPAHTGADGHVCLTVKRTEGYDQQETVIIYAEVAGTQFPYRSSETLTDTTPLANSAWVGTSWVVTDTAGIGGSGVITNTVGYESDPDADDPRLILVPNIPGSTIRALDDNTLLDLAGQIRLAHDGELCATVTKEGTAELLPNFDVYFNFAPAGTTGPGGEAACVEAPLDVELTAFAPGVTSESVTLTDTQPYTLDLLLQNRPPDITDLDQSPQGTIPPSTVVRFTVTAEDPDGDTLSYRWDVDGAEQAGETDRRFNWTSPASGAGTVEIAVTVTDGRGGSDRWVRRVSYGESTGTGGFAVTVYDDLSSQTPVPGVYVVVHDLDGALLCNQQTGTDGVVDCGDVGDRASITLAHEEGEEGYFNRHIDTYHDVPARVNMVYYLDIEDFDSIFCGPGEQEATLDINALVSSSLSGVNVTQVGFLPFYGLANDTGFGSWQMADVRVCSAHVQDDGKLSLLAQGFGTESTLVAYGGLLDQTLITGTLDVDIDTEAARITWGANPSTPINLEAFYGYRKDIEYLLLSDHSSTPPSAAGFVDLPQGFPFEGWVAIASGGMEGVGSTGLWMWNSGEGTIPNTFTIDVMDQTFTEANFFTDTETFTWDHTGSSPVDVTELAFGGESFDEDTDSGGSVYWDIVMDPSNRSWSVPNLPAPLGDWIDNAYLWYAEVSVTDFLEASGFTDLWNEAITGADPQETSSRMMSASTMWDTSLINDEGAVNGVTRAARAAADGGAPEENVDKRPRALLRLTRH